MRITNFFQDFEENRIEFFLLLGRAQCPDGAKMIEQSDRSLCLDRAEDLGVLPDDCRIDSRTFHLSEQRFKGS